MASTVATTGGTSHQRICTASGYGGGGYLPVRRARQGVPTHSWVPSVNCWCFQIGTSALSVSISALDAAKASPRWARLRRLATTPSVP